MNTTEKQPKQCYLHYPAAVSVYAIACFVFRNLNAMRNNAKIVHAACDCRSSHSPRNIRSLKPYVSEGHEESFLFFSAFLQRRGSVCDPFSFLRHLDSQIPSSGVQVHAGYFRQCFHNPPNSDVDYRICNVRTRSFVCVSIHTGAGHTDSEPAQPFLTRQNSVFLVLLTTLEPSTFGSPVQRSITTEPTRHAKR